MKKKIILSLFTIKMLGIINIIGFLTYAQFEVPGNPTIYTQEQIQAISADGIANPIREGAYKVVNAEEETDPGLKVEGIVNADTKIETFESAKAQTLGIIKNFINYALGLLSLVALVYLIYHGILVLTAAGDEAKYKQGIKGIQFASIALAGIGLSRLIISFIFYVINMIITQ